MTKRTWLQRFQSDESGATAIEYALLCGLMSTALVAVLAMGGALEIIYEWVNEVLAAIGGEVEDVD